MSYWEAVAMETGLSSGPQRPNRGTWQQNHIEILTLDLFYLLILCIIVIYKFVMDNQNIFVLGCLTVAVAISAFILWGPTPRPKKKKGHIVGLVNLGSTCFLNTLLQALASCALFIQWLSQQKQEEHSLTSSLHHVLWVLNGQGTGEVYAPVGVLSALKRHGWMVTSGEQDAHELFNVIVSTLQEESVRSLKLGSLTDALSTSDTLSQTSEILEDPSAQEDLTESQDKPKEKNEFKKSILGEGDDSNQKFNSANHSSNDTITNYEDALEKMNHGDSISHSSTTAFYSLEESCSTPIKNDCGDVDSPIKTFLEVENSKENSLLGKSNLVKSYIQKFKASQESFKEKSPDFSGFYDRVTGCSPCIPQADAPPFQGLLTSTLQCSMCGHCSSLRYDTFDSVSLPLGDNFHFQVQRLQDLLQKFVKTEIIPEVECEKCCKKTTAFKTLNFGKLPPCLCLRIARTAWHTYSSTPTKREDYVDFPEYLPMDDYTVSARLKKESSLKTLKTSSVENVNKTGNNYKHVYRLKSVVVHLGGVSSGHFLTYRRGALNTANRHRIGKLEGACMDSQRWYLTSDDSVKLSTLYEAMDSVAYMLFYEKCTTESTVEEALKATVPTKIFIFDNKEGNKN